MDNMKYIIGIDGGGTNTIGLLATISGECVARTQAGPSNYHVVGTKQTQDILKEVVKNLLSHIDDISLDSIYFCLGMAGLGRDEDKKVIGQVCDDIGIGKNRILTHDAHIALVGGTGKQEGVIIISGTGSIVYGVDNNDVEARAGGWGYILGDEGSGYDIAIKGLQGVVRAADQRDKPTQLTDVILKQLKLKQPSELIRWAYTADRDKIAQLSQVVIETAEIGDSKADAIINSAVYELAHTFAPVVKQLEFTHPLEVVFNGGNLIHNNVLSDRLKKWIEMNFPGSSVMTPKHEPVYGAVLLAMANI